MMNLMAGESRSSLRFSTLSGGAALVQQEGGSETLVTLIRYHQEHAPPNIGKDVQELLERLQTADGMN